jgi:hypothetical protein
MVTHYQHMIMTKMDMVPVVQQHTVITLGGMVLVGTVITLEVPVTKMDRIGQGRVVIIITMEESI